ncbi:large ribosomal subunit protein bL20m isoform X1 [Alexandromys fortis]|uniref:large ribosomal subunit protein bL20m isoform X1 n=1 Tax=Alexandromys fortis TaxID=100897 RepID=UPI0021523A00|nr:39S ribosomal protein L20, mitochondrial isoform X1 [Microtus fortis]
MVFLTTRLWLRNRLTDRFWRVQEVLKHARHFRGRKNRCYRLAVRAVTRAFVKSTQARRLKKRNLRTLWINRISAASQEHGLQYPAFMVNLIKIPPQLQPSRSQQEGLRTKVPGLNRAVMLSACNCGDEAVLPRSPRKDSLLEPRFPRQQHRISSGPTASESAQAAEPSG